MLRVFQGDDEPPARARMRQVLAGVGDVVVAGEAEDASFPARHVTLPKGATCLW